MLLSGDKNRYRWYTVNVVFMDWCKKLTFREIFQINKFGIINEMILMIWNVRDVQNFWFNDSDKKYFQIFTNIQTQLLLSVILSFIVELTILFPAKGKMISFWYKTVYRYFLFFIFLLCTHYCINKEYITQWHNEILRIFNRIS